MKDTKPLRSDCPISYSLDVVGDKWTLLIVRDIVFAGKRSFNEFLTSKEKIARNILAERLVRLEKNGIIVKKQHPLDGRKDQYSLTDKGLGLVYALSALGHWGAQQQAATAPADSRSADEIIKSYKESVGHEYAYTE